MNCSKVVSFLTCLCLLSNCYRSFGRDQNRCVDRSHSESCTISFWDSWKWKCTWVFKHVALSMAKCFDISWKMVEVWTVAPEIFFWGGGGIWKKMSSKCFHQIQSPLKPCTEVILRYLSIKGPSKHLCTRWYKDDKVLNNSPRKQHWGTIVPEDNTNKENNTDETI